MEEENEESGESTINFTVTAAYQVVGYEPEETDGTETEGMENDGTDAAAGDAAVTAE